ncbi:glycine cleavage system protein GcvH [Rapidithrix thailandica]|uniref:Glycine cleavage system H protein n=1 Tax=Rapidithrix thailandica TaxID=413964 RepID=A0AAW9RTP9_9BACT
MNIPADLRYTKDHEWVKVEGELLVVGITDFAQRELGDIVFVDITTEGENVPEGEVFGSVEAVKTVSDLFMPITGEVVEINEGLEDEPEAINNEPYEGGWMIKIKPDNAADVENLLNADAYKELIGA